MIRTCLIVMVFLIAPPILLVGKDKLHSNITQQEALERQSRHMEREKHRAEATQPKIIRTARSGRTYTQVDSMELKKLGIKDPNKFGVAWAYNVPNAPGQTVIWGEIVRDADGKEVLMNQKKAQEFCESIGAQLPNIFLAVFMTAQDNLRDLADFDAKKTEWDFFWTSAYDPEYETWHYVMSQKGTGTPKGQMGVNNNLPVRCATIKNV